MDQRLILYKFSHTPLGSEGPAQRKETWSENALQKEVDAALQFQHPLTATLGITGPSRNDSSLSLVHLCVPLPIDSTNSCTFRQNNENNWPRQTR